MKHKLATSIAAVCCLAAPPTGAGLGFTSDSQQFAKATVGAQSDRIAYAPGEDVIVDVLLEVERGWHVNSHTPTYDYLIPTQAEIAPPPGWPAFEMTYPEGELQSFSFSEEMLSVYDGQFVIRATSRVPAEADLGAVPLSISVRYQACDDRKCLPPVTASTKLTLDVASESAPGVASERAVAPQARAPAGRRELAGFLLFGVLGGLLLNAMPCVLPVLSLKLMGLVKSAAQERRAVVMGSLATTFGILVSFWALALAAILAKSAGATVGWGVQFQQPVFVTALTLIVTLFCLNLWGLFEVPLPRSIAGWAEASGGEGIPAHFSAGLFATLMATPCSAPFLGTAVGFALAQESGVILAIFTAVGLGMALPYLALAVAPSALKLMPRPGAWMDHFRTFMGFLLAAAAVWLLYVLSSQVSRERLAFIEIALLVLALCVWIRHRANGGAWRWIGIVGATGAGVAGLLLATGALQPSAAAASENPTKLISWVDFDRSEAERLASQGKYVFVDVTADWCFTCKVNERLVLETPEIATAFWTYQIVPMKADWTNRDDAIADFLADHGKYGIPFYLLYRPGREPHLFSELLTKDAVLDVLRETADSGQPF
ncbi:MAG: thioredoxin family protein [Thermoanaerobaculia bacterium]